MSNDRTQTDIAPITFSELCALNADEEISLNKYLKDIESTNPSSGQLESLIKELGSLTPQRLYALSRRSPQLDQFMDTNEALANTWAQRLKKLKYPDFKITSFNRKQTVSQFSHLKISGLLTEFLKYKDGAHDPKARDFLNKACELGSYHALVIRLQYYVEVITKDEGLDKETKDNYTDYALKDATRLSNLYWAIGSLNAALELFNIVNYYFEVPGSKLSLELFFMPAQANKFSWVGLYDDKKNQIAITLLERAVEFLYLTYLIDGSLTGEEKATNENITSSISHDEGLLAGHEEFFQSMQDLQKLAVERLHNLKVPLVEAFCRKATEHAVAIIQDTYKDYEPSEKIVATLDLTR